MSNPSNKAMNEIGAYAKPTAMEYEDVAASQTGQILGTTGAPGDYLSHLVCVVATAAQSSVALLDGAVSRNVLPAAVGPGLGTYTIPIGAGCTTAWKVTTGSGVTVIAVGLFS